MILKKNRLIVLYLKHSPFFRISIRVKTIHHADYENIITETTESVFFMSKCLFYFKNVKLKVKYIYM